MHRSTRCVASAPWLAMLVTVGACTFFDPLRQEGLGVLLSPPDTALYVGAQFRARGLMENSYGDQYPSTHLRYAGLDPSATVDVGGTVTGIAYGRARVVVTRANLADTGWVSVVPTGTLAVATRGDRSTVFVVNSDGSGLQTVALTQPYHGGTSAWLPGNAGLVYESVVQDDTRGIQLVVTDLAGHSRQLVPLGQDPRASRDGNWVYFRYVVGGGEIWRVHPEGTGLEQLRSSPNSWVGAGDPDPSPDGTQLVFWTTHIPDDGFQLTVRILASGTERLLGVAGLLPRWAPGGDLIAFWKGDAGGWHGAIFVVNPDGTGVHQVSAVDRNYRPAGLDWSPDGQWLVARADTTLDLIQVATGLTLPLGYSGGHFDASWRR